MDSLFYELKLCAIIFYLMLKLSQIWAVEALSTLASMEFEVSPSLFERFLPFWQKVFQTFTFPDLTLQNEPWFLLVENGIGNQYLAIRCAHC